MGRGGGDYIKHSDDVISFGPVSSQATNSHSDPISHMSCLGNTVNIVVNFSHHSNCCTVTMADLFILMSAGWCLSCREHPVT